MRLLRTAALFLGLLLSLARAQTVFRVGCNTTNDGGFYSITCTEAEGSDTIVSYNYTINGVFQGTSELLSHRNCMCFNELGSADFDRDWR